VPEESKDSLVDKGFAAQYGARPIRRTIQNMIEDPLAEGMLQNKYRPGDLIEAVIDDGTLNLVVRDRHEDLLRELPSAALSAGDAE
jgi:ATP-dependent Clp protease ATP-binding subunit ClpC